MQSNLYIKTKVLPGNKIEISVPELPVGEDVEVFVALPEKLHSTPRTAMSVLEELAGQRLFKTSEQADRYVQEEREAWEH